MDWSSDSLPVFPDLLNDSPFGDLNFESQSVYPPLEFDLSSFPNFRDPGDKMNNFLQFRSPPPTISRSLDDGQFGRSSSLFFDPNPSSCQAAVALHTPPFQIWAGDVHQRSVKECVRQLSDLSLRLYEHSNTIPPQCVHDPIPENESYMEVMKARTKDYSSYRVDDTFQLTQELVDVYPSFMNIFTPRKTPQASQPSSRPTNVEPEIGTSKGPIASSLSNPLALDHSSILLLLSCHLRLIEIYDELLKHMKFCIDMRGAACMNEEASFTAPRLRIGDYYPPDTAAVPMMMLLLLHFAKSLRDYAVELESNIREPYDSGSGSLRPESEKNGSAVAALSQASAEKVKERATSMLQNLSSLRTMLLAEGYLA